MELIILIGSFFLLVILGVPIAFALGISSLIICLLMGLPITTLINQTFHGINSFVLLAVPFFLIAGNLMNLGGVTDRLTRLSRCLVGHIRGGLGHVNVLVSMIFAGLSGSAAADTAGVGGVLIPAMLKSGFDKPFTVAITAASSTIGVIIPPSIPMVLYGAFGEVSIGALFLGGVIPGILVGLSQMLVVAILAARRNYPSYPRASLGEAARSIWESLPPLGMPILIIGGIVGGVFTPTEASVVALVYGLIITMFIYRESEVNLKRLPRLLGETALFYSLPLICVATSGAFGWLIAYLNGPQLIVGFVENLSLGYYGMYAVIIFMLLILGTFLSPIVIIIVFLPVLQGLGDIVQINPVHLGVITVMVTAIGLITPPYGMCLFIAAGLADLSIMKSFKAMLLLIGMFLVVVTFCVVFPEVILFLPKRLMPTAV
ncbi:MAG: TRAP transporter large permease [Syntrophaceae bacterium]|nr:TRAP transporter large permease [Syntrophaceae bacterium]